LGGLPRLFWNDVVEAPSASTLCDDAWLLLLGEVGIGVLGGLPLFRGLRFSPSLVAIGDMILFLGGLPTFLGEISEFFSFIDPAVTATGLSVLGVFGGLPLFFWTIGDSSSVTRFEIFCNCINGDCMLSFGGLPLFLGLGLTTFWSFVTAFEVSFN